jgi:hypothetical protein
LGFNQLTYSFSQSPQTAPPSQRTTNQLASLNGIVFNRLPQEAAKQWSGKFAQVGPLFFDHSSIEPT